MKKITRRTPKPIGFRIIEAIGILAVLIDLIAISYPHFVRAADLVRTTAVLRQHRGSAETTFDVLAAGAARDIIAAEALLANEAGELAGDWIELISAARLAPAPAPQRAEAPAPASAAPDAAKAIPPAPLKAVNAADIKATIGAYTGRVKFCFAKKPDAAGVATIRFVVHPDGGVTDVNLAQSTLGSADIEQCLLRHVSVMRFPAFDGAAKTITVPFRMDQRSAPAPGGATTAQLDAGSSAASLPIAAARRQ